MQARNLTWVLLLSGVALLPPGSDIYQFRLDPTRRAPGAEGKGVLALAQTPFGIALSSDGHVVYEMTLRLAGLPRLPDGAGFVAWISDPGLERVERLGAVPDSAIVRSRISSWNKFLVIVTAEPDPLTEVRRGPVVLQGRSPSGYMESFQSHELFVNVPD